MKGNERKSNKVFVRTRSSGWSSLANLTSWQQPQHGSLEGRRGECAGQSRSSPPCARFSHVFTLLWEVNRLCLAAEKPLLEAGSTGHLGQAGHEDILPSLEAVQVTVIRKGQTECFECQAKPSQKARKELQKSLEIGPRRRAAGVSVLHHSIYAREASVRVCGARFMRSLGTA